MTKADDILNTDYVNDKDLNEKGIEDIKEEYDFEDIKDTLAKGNIPQQLKHFLEVTIKILWLLVIC